VIDFNTFPNSDTELPGGTYVEDEWYAAYGLKLSASGGYGTVPRLFNTSDVGNARFGDPDLGAPNEKCTPAGPGTGVGGEPGAPGENCQPQGNVLIIQEKNANLAQPDDNVDGGVIVFDFETPVYVYEIGLLDMDYEASLEITSSKLGGTPTVKTIPITSLGDNSYQVVSIDTLNVLQIKLKLARSGAVTFISFCYPNQPPVPTISPGTGAPPSSMSPTVPTNPPGTGAPPTFTSPSVPTNPPGTGAPPTSTSPSVPTNPPGTGAPPTNPLATNAPPTPSAGAPPSLPTTGPGNCDLIKLDFNVDSNGNAVERGRYVKDEWLSYGMTLFAEGGVNTLPRIFDTSNPGTRREGDPDLGSPNKACPGGGPGIGVGGEPGQPGENCSPKGNVLIIQEPGTNVPDDNVDGGTINFDFPFANGLYVKELGILDADDVVTIVVVYLSSTGLEQREIAVPLLGDNSAQTIEIDQEGVKWIKIMLERSGAVSDITFCPWRYETQ